METIKARFTLLFVPQFGWFQKIFKQVAKKVSSDGESMSNYLIGLAVEDFDRKGMLTKKEKQDWLEYDKKSRKTKASVLAGEKQRFSLYMPIRLPWFYSKLKEVSDNRSTYIWDLMLQANPNLLDETAREVWIEHCSKFNRTTAMKSKVA